MVPIMMAILRYLFAGALLALSIPAAAVAQGQCNGQVGALYICGSVGGGPIGASPFTQYLDQLAGSTPGLILSRGSSVWQGVTALPNGTTATTQTSTDNTAKVATDQFVQSAIGAGIAGVLPITITPSAGINYIGIANGASVANPGTGTLEALVPSQTVTGTSKVYATADLWKRTRRSNSGSAMADALPVAGATGMVNGTRIEIKNVDATAVDTISAGAGTTIIGGASFVLQPGRDLELTYDAANTAWRAEANTDTAVLTISAPVGGLPLYAAPTATGTGSCLSSGNACTLATACQFVRQIATFLASAGPINLANGTYNTVDLGTSSLCPILGNSGGSSSQLTSIIGNCGSPSSVILAVPNNDLGIYVKDGGEAAVSCFEVTLGSGAEGFSNSGQGSVLDYGNIIWGTSGANSVHVSGVGGAYTNLDGTGETISANFVQHWSFTGDAQFIAGGATAISNSTTFTDFLVATGNPYLNLVGWSFTGSSLTGVRAVLTGPGYLIIPSPNINTCTSFLPGTSGGKCSFSLGFQDNAGDGMTGTGIVVGQNQPTISDPIITPQLYSSLPVSPTAGQIDHIIDGLAANCGDGVCTTPGATVTGGGGGGGLDLLLEWYASGAAWHICCTGAVPSLNNLLGPLAVNKGGTGGSSASGTLLDNITGFSSTGFIKRTGAGTYTFTADPSDVTSVFGRTGAVVAATNDYNFNQLAGTAAPAQLPTATASAQGALPAWPNNTTTYFRGDGTYVTHNCAALTNAGTICPTSPGTGLSIASTSLNSNAQNTVSFSPGLVAAVVNTKGAFTKWPKASTVDNIEGSASTFTCTGNPTITFYECGTSTTCATPTTIGSATVTAAGTVVDGTVSNPAITAGDYTAWAVSAGTCTGLDIFGTAQVHSN
jgi:hypothetical protein